MNKNNKNRQNKKKNKKFVYPAVAGVLLLGMVTLGWALSSVISSDLQEMGGQTGIPLPTSDMAMAEESAAAVTAEELNVRFSAVGDNLIHNGIYLQAQARAGGDGYDFTYAYENVSDFLTNFDVNWMNQETLITWDIPASTYPMFASPGELGEAAYAAGWRVFSTSNNHSYDKGAQGIASTLDYWAGMPEDTLSSGFYVPGQEAEGIKVHEVNGIEIAYVAFTETTNGLPKPADAVAEVIYTNEPERMQALVEQAKSMADAVVVSLHWGTENSHTIREDQRILAAQLADWGADAIIGTHPHVVQGVEMVQGTATGRSIPVAYSLGNFLSAQSQANQMIGLCLTFDIKQTVYSDGTEEPIQIENIQVYPTVTHYESNYNNIRVYMYEDYTSELAAQHGVLARYSGFNMEYIQGLLQEHISPEYLVLT